MIRNDMRDKLMMVDLISLHIISLIFTINSFYLRKGPAKTGGGEEAEWFAMMWGSDQKFSSSTKADKAGSDDEQSESGTKKRKAVAVQKGRSRNQKPSDTPAEIQEVELGVTSSAASSTGWNVNFQNPPKTRKVAQEQKELDKCESLALQANQLKAQMEDGRAVLQVTVKKVNDVLEKIQGKLSEDSTKFFLEIIRIEGAGCRAQGVWQQLKDARTLVDGIADFVESLQDAEAAPATIRTRAGVIKSLGVKLPRNINSVICRRAAEELVNSGEVDQVFEFLDMNSKDKHPEGICSIVPDSDLSDAATMDKVTKDFQTFCLTTIINNMLLKEVGEPAQCLGKMDLGF